MNILCRYTFDDGHSGGTKDAELTLPGLSSSPMGSQRGSSAFTLGNPGMALFDYGWMGNGGNWFSFTLAPAPGEAISLSSMSFSHMASMVGPTGWRVRTSHDGFSSDVGSGSTALTGEWHNAAITMAVYTTVPLEVRMYASGAPQDSGIWRIDNVEVGGSVGSAASSSSSSSSSTSPSSMSSFPHTSSSSGSSFSSGSSTSSISSSSSSTSSSSSSVVRAGTSSSSSSSTEARGRSSTSSSSHSSSSSRSSQHILFPSSSSSSSSNYHRWRAVALDIDEATGEAYVAVESPGRISYIIRVNPSATGPVDQCSLPPGYTINAIYVEQGPNGLLPFYFESVAARESPADMPFSFTGTETGTDDFNNLVDLSPTTDTVARHLGPVGVMVWGRGHAGLGGAREGVVHTFDAAGFHDPVAPIRLPVFTWSSGSIRRLPSIMVALSDGTYKIMDYDPVSGKAKARAITGDLGWLIGNGPATSMAVNPGGNTVFVVNRTGMVEVDPTGMVPVAAVETGEGHIGGGGAAGLSVSSFLPDGTVMGCSGGDGSLFSTHETVINSSSSSPLF